VDVRVAEGHVLVGALGGGVEGKGLAHGVLAEWGRYAGAIDAGGGGEDEVLGRIAARGLEDVGKADEVAVHIGLGVGEAVAHASLGAEVDDVVGLEAVDQAEQRGSIGEIGADEAEALAPFESGEASLLEGDGVVIVDVVDPEHLGLPR
jgi:hypothetical protein